MRAVYSTNFLHGLQVQTNVFPPSPSPLHQKSKYFQSSNKHYQTGGITSLPLEPPMRKLLFISDMVFKFKLTFGDPRLLLPGHPHHRLDVFFFCTLLLSSFWTSRGHRCRPFSPPVVAFNFYPAQGLAIPLLVDFSSSVAISRSRAFRKSICAREKVPTNLYNYALEGIRTHETDLYQARR